MKYFSFIYKDFDGSYYYFLSIFKQGIEKPIEFLADKVKYKSVREAINSVNELFKKYVSTV